jgi:hypothetical protein
MASSLYFARTGERYFSRQSIVALGFPDDKLCIVIRVSTLSTDTGNCLGGTSEASRSNFHSPTRKKRFRLESGRTREGRGCIADNENIKLRTSRLATDNRQPTTDNYCH